MRETGQPPNDIGSSDRVLPHPLLVSKDLLLDTGERRILGIEMAPLLTGEFKLLTYLGSRPRTWHSTYNLSVQVYQRDDAAGRQLVWKYASTLRKKLAIALPDLIALCRRRGYSCRSYVRVIDDDALIE